MKNAVVLMTALVPTRGHKALIDFASTFVGETGSVDVIVSCRSFEPIPWHMRVHSLREEFDDHENVHIHLHFDDNAPQNPSTDEEWIYWKRVCDHSYHGSFYYPHTHLIASEPYGKKMAEIIGAEFVPYDLNRSIVPVKGTDVRNNFDGMFSDLIPAFQRKLMKRITMFGQESTGKTTMTKSLGEAFDCPVVPEFARPYLEMMDDKTVTDEKMSTIVDGQHAIMMAALNASRPLIFQDTDLLSTIGYYRIYGGDSSMTYIEYYFTKTKSDLYIVCPDNIPFEPDPLRYGGHVRESSMQFWIDLLEEYNCNYVVLNSSNPIDRFEEAVEIVNEHCQKWFGPIIDFVRE